MARKPTGKPVGPPPKIISFELYEQLCGLWCTTEEIAAHLKVHADTLRKKIVDHYGEEYSVTYKRFFDAGKPSLRRDQRVQAKKNASMAIWLGKNYLDQREPEKNFDKSELAQVIEAVLEINNRQRNSNKSTDK